MLELKNLFNLLKTLNYDKVETLDLTNEEDNKKFKAAIKLVKDYKKDCENDSIMSLLSNLIDDDVLDEAEKLADQILEESSNKGEEKIENACSECEKEYCDNCPFFEDVDDNKKEEIIRPSEQLENTDIKLQIHRLVNEYCDEYIKPYVNNDHKGKELVNNAYAGLYEFACWIYNKK